MDTTNGNRETSCMIARAQDHISSVSGMRFYASVTQLPESRTSNPVDASSNLAGGLLFCLRKPDVQTAVTNKLSR